MTISKDKRDVQFAVYGYFLFLTLGFYIGCFVVTACVGDAAMNEAVPKEWKLVMCIPAAVALFWALLLERKWVRDGK